jgi:hypothetical protein
MTGVLDISHGLIARSGSITEISDGNIGKIWTQKYAIDLRSIATLDGVLYDIHSGALTPRDPKMMNISTSLDTISHVSGLADDMFII